MVRQGGGKVSGHGETPGLQAWCCHPSAVCMSQIMVAGLLNISWKVGPALHTYVFSISLQDNF